MNELTPESPPRHQFNPVFWLMWLLPGAAVIGGLATLAIALRNGDRPLPTSYHWEGERLDADFARARRAAQLGIAVQLDLSGAGGQCVVSLTPASAGGDALELLLTHGVDVGLDRMLRLTRVDEGTSSARYRAPCAVPPSGRWRISLQDAAGSWALRAGADNLRAPFALRARMPEG